MANISIIIPCYNCEDTINKTLSSLEGQTYKEFEVVVINDGSVDQTEKVIYEYLENTTMEINYIYQENQGVSVARNTGILKSVGEYILFLDADDIYHKEFVGSMYMCLINNGVDIVYSLTTRQLENLAEPLNLTKLYNTDILSQDILMSDFLFNKDKIGFCTFIYKKKVILDNKIFFPVNRKTAEDLEFAWKYICHCKTAIKIDTPLYGYYDNSNSVTNTVFWERTHSLKSFEEISNYLHIYNEEFAEIYDNYMYSRAMWSYAKTFSLGRRQDLFNRLIKELNLSYHMKNIIPQTKDWRVKITALVYCIKPSLFYKSMVLFSTLKEGRK